MHRTLSFGTVQLKTSSSEMVQFSATYKYSWSSLYTALFIQDIELYQDKLQSNNMKLSIKAVFFNQKASGSKM